MESNFRYSRMLLKMVIVATITLSAYELIWSFSMIEFVFSLFLGIVLIIYARRIKISLLLLIAAMAGGAVISVLMAYLRVESNRVQPAFRVRNDFALFASHVARFGCSSELMERFMEIPDPYSISRSSYRIELTGGSCTFSSLGPDHVQDDVLIGFDEIMNDPARMDLAPSLLRRIRSQLPSPKGDVVLVCIEKHCGVGKQSYINALTKER